MMPQHHQLSLACVMATTVAVRALVRGDNSGSMVSNAQQ
jgi:hypothetical protein